MLVRTGKVVGGDVAAVARPFRFVRSCRVVAEWKDAHADAGGSTSLPTAVIRRNALRMHQTLFLRGYYADRIST